jgi:hypothetical protein
VPGAGNPAAWDRYGYTLYNPVRYVDPSGHWPVGDDVDIADIYDSSDPFEEEEESGKLENGEDGFGNNESNFTCPPEYPNCDIAYSNSLSVEDLKALKEIIHFLIEVGHLQEGGLTISTAGLEGIAAGMAVFLPDPASKFLALIPAIVGGSFGIGAWYTSVTVDYYEGFEGFIDSMISTAWENNGTVDIYYMKKGGADLTYGLAFRDSSGYFQTHDVNLPIVSKPVRDWERLIVWYMFLRDK